MAVMHSSLNAQQLETLVVVQFEIHRGGTEIQPVGNCSHVRETNQSRQSTTAGGSTRKEAGPPPSTEEKKKTSEDVNHVAARIVREATGTV
jgi:hypothetical protein